MSYTHSKQYVCICHDCGNDIAQYVSQSVLHVKVRGPTKAFFLVSPGCPNNLTFDNTPLLLRLLKPDSKSTCFFCFLICM